MKKVLVLATCLVLLLAGAAQADTVQVQFTGVSPSEVAYITAPAILNSVGVSAPFSGGVYAGMYNFNILGSGPYAGSYKGFCVDPQFEIPLSTATVTAVTDGSKYEAAAYLMNKYYGDTSVNNQKAAQVQLAIWELVWDFSTPGGYNLASGAFQTTTYTTAVNALITEATAAGVLAGFNPSGYYVTVSPDGQDFLFRQVPEAGALLLFGTGLVGLVGYRRVRRMQ